jgi:histidine triad (HIT) family protein
MKAFEEQQHPNSCFICQKHRGEIYTPGGILYEDAHVMVFHAPIPEGDTSIYLGYLMIELKRHAPGLADMTYEEAQSVGIAMSRVSKALISFEQIEHIYSFVIGHHVPHLHIQIVPRYVGTPREYWGPKVTSWPDAPVGGHDQITEFANRLRKYLKLHKN